MVDDCCYNPPSLDDLCVHNEVILLLQYPSKILQHNCFSRLHLYRFQHRMLREIIDHASPIVMIVAARANCSKGQKREKATRPWEERMALLCVRCEGGG